MEIKQLHALVAIADTGNMTRAAKTLSRVQPALSRQLSMLEEELGVSLFVRERRGMILTDAGKTMVLHARRALLVLDGARAELGGSNDEVAGIVTIGLLPSTSEVLAGPLVTAVAHAHPSIRVRLAMGYAGDLRQWLEDGDIDAAILYGIEHEPQFQARPLLNEPLWVVGPPSASLNKRRPVPIARLARWPFILPSGPHGVRTMMDRACAIAQVALDVRVETNAMSLQKALVLAGHGFTILPPISFVSELNRGTLSGAPLKNPDITRGIVLAVSAHRAISRPVRSTIDLLVQSAHKAVRAGAWPYAQWIDQ